jgi:hypothetical protein
MVSSMFKDILAFYWLCIRRAFGGKFWKAERWSGGLGLVAALFLLFWPQGNEASRMLAALPLWFFLTIFVATVVFGLIVAPFLLYDEEKQKGQALTRRIEPKLRVWRDTSRLQYVPTKGETSETYGGRRITADLGAEHVATLQCTNEGLGTLEACRCTLVAVWKVENGEAKRLNIWEQMELAWNRDKKNPDFYAYIEPNETRTLYLAQVHPAGHAWLYRDMKSLPLEYQQLFGGIGKYQVLLQFKSTQPDPLHVLIDLDIRESRSKDAMTPPPEHSTVVISDQGAPPLRLPDTVA